MATRGKKMVERVKELMDKPEKIRNIGICAHIDHGKTTLSDNLLAGSGMISMELAGKQLFMDFDEEEQARGITINAANVSMVHEVGDEEYLINLIDTPGHVDFGGDVTRAMRAVDGAVVVVDAVEGTMPQTETVLRQALRENVKPILFINKVDRLINELKIDKKDMPMRLGKVIDHVNKLIKSMAPEHYEKDGWRLDASKGTVCFGSALYKWAISVPSAKRTGIGFNEVYEYCKANNMKELAQKSPLHAVLLDAVVHHLPNPIEAQKVRIPVIWRGDKESKVGRDLLTANPSDEVVFMVTKILTDPHAGEVAVGRLFAGTLERGQELYISGTAATNRVQSVAISMGADRVEVERIPAGNIAAVTGLKDAIVGSTASTVRDMTPFEAIKHVSEPVMTVAVEAKNMKDLPKLVEALRQVAKEDPTVKVEINEETGEHLISGMGELHLEIVTKTRITRDRGIEVVTSEPIVVYRETVSGKAGPIEGKSPNKHNRFYVHVEPLEQPVFEAIKNGDFSMNMMELDRRKLLESLGMDKEEAKGITHVYGTNVLIDMTKGIQYLKETMELIIEGMEEALKNGPLAREPAQGIKIKLVDVKLHEDAVHRGPAQVIPAVRSAIQGGILMAGPTLLEPVQKVFISVPQTQMGAAVREIQGRRGIINDIKSEGDMSIIEGQAPVAELFGFASDIRGATEGRALWNTEFLGFFPVPASMQNDIVISIRKRKGLKAEIPKPSDFLE
ncbi:translation elongation factor 2 (EF-2/EF-G) [Methanocella conradii HZ254]|uniref:Elongation factor 2 n=1 Tax=Methanocella conradii (strain DSM 24694 / JCM 17849 / CGMCC 1.5162 / HZ254) TaxID=1041930 RepID=H8I872_METCZ|nr:elongation factor EF-2 [Methanocella conradii]AFD00890.1 translation elongation factor 2 (EF-2/EF-G) [Methanocella conradii HZ254]MDI6897571.1 elongation factor EF-2 [Methanocella conradii]